MHEAWGLVDWVRDVCDRLARSGFVALAPDLFGGKTVSDAASAWALLSKLTPESVAANLDAAVQALLSDSSVDGPKLGCLGFCAGGHLALFGASRNPRIGAVVDCYGFLPEFPLELQGMEASALAIFGAQDEFIPQEKIAALEAELSAAGGVGRVQVLSDVGHGFMNEDRPDRYDAHAAAQAWELIDSFLRAELL